MAHGAPEPDAAEAMAATAGRAGATVYFYQHELPKIGAWRNAVENRDSTCAGLAEEAF